MCTKFDKVSFLNWSSETGKGDLSLHDFTPVSDIVQHEYESAHDKKFMDYSKQNLKTWKKWTWQKSSPCCFWYSFKTCVYVSLDTIKWITALFGYFLKCYV